MAPGARSASLLLAAVLASGPVPAAAQQPVTPGERLVLPMPRVDWPIDGAAPDLGPLSPGREPPIDCGRELPCRMRLRGVLGRNGAVALEGTAFTW